MKMKKAKGSKNSAIKGKLKFEVYKSSVEDTQTESGNYLENINLMWIILQTIIKNSQKAAN